MIHNKGASNRVTVRSDVVFQRDEDKVPKCWGEPHSFPVHSEEPAFERTVKLDGEWQELDFAWVKDPVMVILRNLPTRFQVNPTPEQQAQADAKVVELAVMGGDGFRKVNAQLSPGRETNLEPRCPIWARCEAGTTKLSVVAIPR